MAKTVTEFPSRNGSGSVSKYAPYLDGQIWRLDRGTDFNGTSKPVSIVMAVRSAAKARGLTVTIRIVNNDCLYVQAKAATS